ncbi:hypothetical protein Nepgr_018477 [Nepenthes gracilis]|uniref:SCP domain-containing protein n=1 Tax=Nepenthes gracilis TaxID=150966 RepID=A0AAD3XUC7_NEPGR|nr:hypothetical protein Nepgr_018477 [Nepenthes gracilis]
MDLYSCRCCALTTLLFLLSVTTSGASYYRTPTTRPVVSRPPTPKKTSYLAYQFLAPHNAARAAVGLPPLVWDGQVAGYAQWSANQRRYDCALVHSNGPYGENIFWGSGSEWTPRQAVESWVAEGKSYDYYSNSCRSQDCGHYTQIVWRSSKRLGCARVVCYGGAGVFITCNYDPPGNYVGQRPY